MTYSIITVCFNSEVNIRETIESVLNQDCLDYEYIIIDGKSTDGTIDIVNSYKDLFTKKGVQFRFVSEKDSGIYNAMNKGIKMANGLWINFMNAGDVFYNNKVLSDFKKSLSDEFDVVYGEAVINYLGLYKLMNFKKTINEGMLFCHQSCFTKTSVMKKYLFDEQYRISGDYDFFCKAYTNKCRFLNVDKIVSVYEYGGASTSPKKTLSEYIKIQHNYGFLSDEERERKENELNKIAKAYKRKQAVEKMLPKRFINWVRINNAKKSGYKTDIKDI